MGAVVCYDCLDMESFKNADTWMTEFSTKARPNAPMILVANKKDKITDDSTNVVPPEQGQELAQKYGAAFFETSAFTGENVTTVFDKICELILVEKYPKLSDRQGSRNEDPFR